MLLHALRSCLQGQHERSVEWFRRALRLCRTYLSAWTLMGHEFVEMKNAPAAIGEQGLWGQGGGDPWG
jgi:hypothetical protein